MAVIQKLPAHLANLIAAGEVVERPASVVKELVENAVDAGATKIVVELRDGGMTFLRVTDNGCGMDLADARTAFLRHATSKIRREEDLEAITTMGFRGEALAAIAAVSRIDLLTKQAGAVGGVSLHLEAGVITEESEAGCPQGTTIMVRDLFFNTPARMKFMKQDSVEGGAVAGAVQRQALAHPEVAIRLIRDGKEILNTPGDGKLLSAMAGIYGKEAAAFIPVDSKWEKNRVWGYVTKPTQAKASRAWQIFFVGGRPVKSRLLQAALEEAYRNQMMVGKFPACVVHIDTPPHKVDVNVHPAKTEVKFLAEREIFDCVHYGVLAALGKTQDRPEVRFASAPAGQMPPQTPEKPGNGEKPGEKPPMYKPPVGTGRVNPRPEETFRTMTAQEYRDFAKVLEEAPRPRQAAAEATLDAMGEFRVAQPVTVPGVKAPIVIGEKQEELPLPQLHVFVPESRQEAAPAKVPEKEPGKEPENAPEEAQEAMELPESAPHEVLGELFNTYIVVQQGQEAFLIDKHAAHERILFDKLRAQERQTESQLLLVSQVCRLGAEAAAVVLDNLPLLDELGYGVEEFGQDTVLLRRVPMDLDPQEAAASLEAMAQDLLAGRREDRDTLRDNLLHTIACKAAIKAGWHTTPEEREALVREVLRREELKYCPHGRPVCVKLTRAQLERQFGRS